MKIINQSYEIIYPRTSQDWINEARDIEIAARNCYKSEDKITEDSYKVFLTKIINLGHNAMIEFGNIKARLVTDNGILREFSRHRLLSLAVSSTRYINYSNEKFGKEIKVIRPSGIPDDPLNPIYIDWIESCLEAERKYMHLIERDASPQMARSVLPLCTATEIVFSCNWRELRHIFSLRVINSKAHPDIRLLLRPLYEECSSKMPIIFTLE
jgi:thymidylate synthase (FAD)